ncbi:uncharacterized protein LOC105844597 isoform X1 [Hydra vulgaris]|uniref:Uncharacterized protein LOC105844597 isoform X1 n=1 Tax=Hydra vulgaris TaxID=6087 RepID=A0ABM4BQD4_HYDVU
MSCEIPVNTLKSGTHHYKSSSLNYDGNQSSLNKISHPACSLMYDGTSSSLFFKIPDFSVGNENKCTTLECSDITAADLRVTSKFGSWDTITCRLLIECKNPLVAWKVSMLPLDDNKSNGENYTEKNPVYVSIKQESCMVKATFDVLYANDIKNLLHRVKLAKLKERLNIQELHKRGLEKNIRVPDKIREGLPEWVNYIPAKWYSSAVRQVLEYLIGLYTVLTLCWALWQLYKHVSFIQKYMQPLIDFFMFYLHILTDWFKLLDAYADILSTYWWTYMKPMFLLIYPLYNGLAQLFKPLRNVAGVVNTLFQPFISCAKSLSLALQPLFQPVSNLCGLVTRFLKDIHAMIITTTIYQRIASEINYGSLDPLRAQVTLIRDVIFRSVRNLIFGMKFIFSRIYYTHMFLKREHKYVQEETEIENKEKKH